MCGSSAGFQDRNDREEVECGSETRVPDCCQNGGPWVFLEISSKFFRYINSVPSFLCSSTWLWLFLDKLQKEVCQGEREIQLFHHAGASRGETCYGSGQKAEWCKFLLSTLSQGPLSPGSPSWCMLSWFQGGVTLSSISDSLKKYGGRIGLVLIKRFPVLNEDFWKDSLSLKWVNIFFFFSHIKVAYKKEAKENLHYTTVADRPDIKKATQAAKQASEVRVWWKCPWSRWSRSTSHTQHSPPILVFFDSGGVQSQAPEGGQPWVKHAWSSGHRNGQEGRQAEQPGNTDGQEAALMWGDLKQNGKTKTKNLAEMIPQKQSAILTTKEISGLC